jgi:hypothetical protein
MAPHASTGPPPGLVLRIALFVLLGTPLVAYLWHTLNYLFAGIIEPILLVGLLPAGFLFYLLLRAMARAVEGWHGTGDGPVLP